MSVMHPQLEAWKYTGYLYYPIFDMTLDLFKEMMYTFGHQNDAETRISNNYYGTLYLGSLVADVVLTSPYLESVQRMPPRRDKSLSIKLKIAYILNNRDGDYGIDGRDDISYKTTENVITTGCQYIFGLNRLSDQQKFMRFKRLVFENIARLTFPTRFAAPSRATSGNIWWEILFAPIPQEEIENAKANIYDYESNEGEPEERADDDVTTTTAYANNNRTIIGQYSTASTNDEYIPATATRAYIYRSATDDWRTYTVDGDWSNSTH